MKERIFWSRHVGDAPAVRTEDYPGNIRADRSFIVLIALSIYENAALAVGIALIRRAFAVRTEHNTTQEKVS